MRKRFLRYVFAALVVALGTAGAAAQTNTDLSGTIEFMV